MSQLRALVLLVVVGSPVPAALADMMIEVSYKYDTNNFFNTDTKKAAIEAAAQRFSDIINSSLAAVGPGGTGSGTDAGWRIGFTHPGDGSSYQVSTAPNAGVDPIGGMAANEYGFAGLDANTWILYAGGRALGTAGVGGTGTGSNFTATFEDFNGPMHRGLIPVSVGNSVNDLPVWGGSISFDSNTSWHFDPNTSAPSGMTDLYSIALHEIGHALGLNTFNTSSGTSWNQWSDQVAGTTFTGSEAVAALNADNGTNVAALALASTTNFHWADNTHDSKIFPVGNPNLAGTVGLGALQDLLMEPTADFTSTISRFELTNVDVAALRDVGWSTVAIPEPSAFLFVGLSFSLVAVRRWPGWMRLLRRRGSHRFG